MHMLTTISDNLLLRSLSPIVWHRLLSSAMITNRMRMPTHQVEHAYTSEARRSHSNDQVLAETAFLQAADSQPTRKPTRNNPTWSPFSKLWDKWVSTCSRTWGIHFRIIPRDSKPCRRSTQNHQQLPSLDTHSHFPVDLVRYLPK